MIPAFVSISPHTPWRMLPPGIHQTTLQEIEGRFTDTAHRKWLFDGFCRAVGNLESAGCSIVYLDGSFVTEKEHPDDFDAAWDPMGVDPYKLDPVLLDFGFKRAAQKAKYGGELFIATTEASYGVNYIEFFQKDRYSDKSKGILSIQLGSTV